jgi:hypothetical protein
MPWNKAPKKKGSGVGNHGSPGCLRAEKGMRMLPEGTHRASGRLRTFPLETMPSHGEEIVRLWKEIAESPGGLLRYDLETLEVTVQVFKTNHHWLHELLLNYEDPEFTAKVWPDHIQGFLVEVAVRLHNFVASVGTLIDHTRILVRTRWSGSQFYDEYQGRIQQFRSSPISNLIQDMRNYTLHRQLPATGAQISGNSPPLVFLDVPKLREWKNWSREALKVLDEAKEMLPLRPLIDQYEQMAESLYVWMEGRIRELHADDWAHLDELETRLAELERLDDDEESLS